MEKAQLHAEDTLSTSVELLQAITYSGMSTEVLYGRRLLWQDQVVIPERSERSKEEVGRILARLNFELSAPERQEELIRIESLTSDLAELPETLDNVFHEV